MTKAFPTMMTQGVDEPCRFDIEVFDLEVIEGEIPGDIDGLFVQAVPDHAYPPDVPVLLPMTIAAGGDGAVRAFRIKDGIVDFRSRYVRTERFLLERRARRSLFGNYRDPFSDHPSVAGKSRTTANTAIYFHAGKMLASKEDGLPYEVDPETLETRGVWNAGGAITSLTFTAHPKFDPRTGEMCGFGYAAKGETTRDIAYYVIDKAGTLVHEVWFEAPHSAMIHDCALTQSYMVFPLMPITSDMERLRAGGPHFVYDSEFPQIFGVIPRRGNASQVRWFRAPHAFTGHTVNAYDEAGKITLDVYEADGNGFDPVVPDKHGKITPPGSVRTRLVRWRIDYDSPHDELSDREVLAEVDGEGPHIDPRLHTTPYRHVFTPTLDRNKIETDVNGRPQPVMFNQLSHFDLQSGEREDWFAGPGATLQDPVYFPKSPTAAENDGYMIAVLNWPMEKRSELIILNTLNVPRGPIARIKLPVRMRLGIHATWIDGALVPTWI
jgi:carotenoid cleavage dioxygenase-like enzyme